MGKPPTIHDYIAAIRPDIYCTDDIDEKTGKPLREVVKQLVLKENLKEAAQEAKLVKSELLYNYDDAKADALNLWGLKSPMEQHELIYDSPAEGIEPIYFWLLDFLAGPWRKIEKLSDNFVASPGSGHFSEMQGKATQMQGEVSRTLGNVNTVIKSVLNLVYDLKEFRLRLKPYKVYMDKKTAERDKKDQLLSLKQVWLDNVDIRKGRGSINALASGELDFVTLRDAFMALGTADDAKKKPEEGGLDLNERVRRILIQRAQEFFQWIDESHNSLKQRYEIEKNYLKSQVNMLKLYTRWVKPYLKAAQRLEQNYNSTQAALVSTFNTMILELTLLATAPYDIKDDVDAGLLPDLFKKVKTRNYSKVLVVEFEFRSIPQRVSQRGDWAFGGRTKIKFTSYALNSDELDLLKAQLDKEDFTSVMKLIDGATEDSLAQIQKDLDIILQDKEEDELEKDKKEAEEKKKEEDKKKQDINPFWVAFEPIVNAFKLKKKEPEKFDPSKGIPPAEDNQYEKVIRSQAIISAREGCFTAFDVYKKAHGMPSHDSHFEPL